MGYQQAIDYLFGLQKFGIKLGLENVSKLLSALGNPHTSLHCIHVAGSNGKGSTCAFLQAIFKHAGYATGLYTSPHLSDFTERIRINDAFISKLIVAELVADIKRICQKKSLHTITFFEFTTALAFLYFSRNSVDPVIVETGMGGAFDATNCITPVLTVITSISLEHQKYLGTTINAIASEKAGIIKPGIPLICGVRQKSVQKLFRNKCREAGAEFLRLDNDFMTRKNTSGGFTFEGRGVLLPDLQSGLAGAHQLDNAAVAIAGAYFMKKKGYSIENSAIRNGIQNVRWPGRLELLRSSPAVIADGAHNPEGWRALKKFITQRYSGKKQIFVLGIMQDKDIGGMLRILTEKAFAIIFCKPKIDRAAGYEILKNFISFSEQKKVFWFENSIDAYAKALCLAEKNDLLCITGSLFLVGELREIILKKTSKTSGRIAL